MLRDFIVVVRCHCHWAHVPVIHAASHFYHEKRVPWVSISMHACYPVPIVMGLCLAGAKNTHCSIVEKYMIVLCYLTKGL